MWRENAWCEGVGSTERMWPRLDNRGCIAGLALFLLVSTFLLRVGFAHGWTPAKPGYVWSFPRDHWARDG